MGKIDWRQKLSSRKFWAMLIAVIGAVGAAFGFAEGSVERVASVIGAIGATITYILVEGNIDAKRAADQPEEAPPEDEEPTQG
jgi:hypothetical protein